MQKTRKNMQKFAKPQQNCAKMRKIVQKNVCKLKKLAQLEKISTDGVSHVTLFLHLLVPGLSMEFRSPQGVKNYGEISCNPRLVIWVMDYIRVSDPVI